MNNEDILLTEKCGTLGRIMIYHKNPGSNKITRLSASETLAKSLIDRTKDLFREIFLPHGYPDSVSNDYLEYQVWDTLQAFCSTITGTFTTQAILKSVGVGNAEATPFAAALTWVMKDGTGMIGRIFFAWWKGNSLDADCKKWRLCADILNDTAMFLELLVPFIGRFSLQILCITTSMKAVVGVAGGATRASITQHQAIQGNMADVSAKDGSQETCVNLVASFVGIILLAIVTDWRYEWAIFFLFTIVHLVANYFAVCSLNIPHLNTTRLNQVLDAYFRFNAIPNPTAVNKKESVIIGCGQNISDICGFKIRIGKPLHKLPMTTTSFELNNLIEVYRDYNFIVLPDVKNRVMYVALKRGESVHDVLSAYFHATLLGIATCYYNQVNGNVYAKRHLRHETCIARLFSALKPHQKNVATREDKLVLNPLRTFSNVFKQEVIMFFTALRINGWNLDTHSLEVGEWRVELNDDLTQFRRDYSVPDHSKIE